MQAAKFLSLAALVWVGAGCVATTDHFSLRPWLGHSRRELIAAWGAPEKETSDGRGGRVLTYERASGYVNPGSAIPDDTGKFIVEVTQTSIVTHHQVFYVDSNGKIYLWRRS